MSDDGPTAQTGRLLTVLRDHDATATFFNVGANVQHYPDAAPAEIAVGQVANHSYSHPYLARLPYTAVFRELLGTNQIIASTVGTNPSCSGHRSTGRTPTPRREPESSA